MVDLRRHHRRYALAVLSILVGALISLATGTANFMFPATIVALAITYTAHGPRDEEDAGSGGS